MHVLACGIVKICYELQYDKSVPESFSYERIRLTQMTKNIDDMISLNILTVAAETLQRRIFSEPRCNSRTSSSRASVSHHDNFERPAHRR